MQILTYLGVANLFGYLIDLIVGKVHFGQIEGFPEVLDQSQLIEVAQLHWERFQTLTLQGKSTSLLGALQCALDGFTAGRHT